MTALKYFAVCLGLWVLMALVIWAFQIEKSNHILLIGWLGGTIYTYFWENKK
ncbi:hypothetical protein [Methylotenera sp.]|uniref:hypothetical protein n=1 Tax=Methylotenera sp. TaxID=2051956 RepID=UPI002488FC31|nr:hypothetical protein [Methylotenera sp.]MDI1362540.1 hypothetical protein [Methylotenera sp.]